MNFISHWGQRHEQYSDLAAFWGRLRPGWGMNMLFGWNSRAKLQKKKKWAKSAALATRSSPGQDNCSSTSVFRVCFTNWPGCRSVPPHCWHTEPGTGALLSFCPAGSALGSLKKKRKRKTQHENYHPVPWMPLEEVRGETLDTLFLISRTSFGLVFIGMNWLATAAWRAPSSFDHCKHVMHR